MLAKLGNRAVHMSRWGCLSFPPSKEKKYVHLLSWKYLIYRNVSNLNHIAMNAQCRSIEWKHALASNRLTRALFAVCR